MSFSKVSSLLQKLSSKSIQTFSCKVNCACKIILQVWQLNALCVVFSHLRIKARCSKVKVDQIGPPWRSGVKTLNLRQRSLLRFVTLSFEKNLSIFMSIASLAHRRAYVPTLWQGALLSFVALVFERNLSTFTSIESLVHRRAYVQLKRVTKFKSKQGHYMVD